MIPALPDQRQIGDSQRRPATPASGSTVRFVDLVAESREGATGSAVTDARVPVSRDAAAQVFNEDGFFGSTEAMPADLRILQPDASVTAPSLSLSEPMTSLIPTGFEALPGVAIEDGVMIGKAIAGAAHRAAVQTEPAKSVISIPNRPGYAAMARSRIIDRSNEAKPAPRAAPALRRWPVAAGVSVAVAVHAVARGLDIAARIGGLDPAERQLVADEIAAFLSSHGYPPAQVTVIATRRNRAASLEHR